ncbi:MAG: hypothetical protein ACLQME_17290 [Alphaproteobacteria bacterium]
METPRPKRHGRTWPVQALILLALFAATALGGCIDEPRPFRPAAKPLPSELAASERERFVIVVTPVAGVAAPLDRELADAMMTALEKRSLPVAVGGKGPARVLYTVSARLEAPAPASAAKGPATVRWEVRDESGELLSRYTQLLPPGADLTSAATKAELIADIAREPADMMVKGIEGDAPLPLDRPAASAAERARKPAPGHGLAVDSITGSPATDGDTALRQTIEYALKVAGVEVVQQKARDSLLLDGTVAISRVNEGTQHVKVTWSVKRPDGTVVGEVSQENNVPTRLLERVWGEIASSVSQNAAQGIAALVDEAERTKAK